MPAITMTSERTGHWTKMRRSLGRFSGSGISRHTRFSADFITIMSGFRFSVHTGFRRRGQIRGAIKIVRLRSTYGKFHCGAAGSN